MTSIDERVPTMFDNVRIRETAATTSAGLAGLQGQVYGVTTPSHTGVTVIGESTEDCAYYVHFESSAEDVWLAPEVVEFVNHAPGTTVTVGPGPEHVRQADGTWVERGDEPRKPVWWRRLFPKT
jgi:hypothetical protein